MPPRNQSQYRVTMKTFLIFLLAVAVASAAETYDHESPKYTANLNAYIDKVIANVQVWIKERELDPLTLPNVTRSFSTKPVWITYSGRLSLFDGLLSNLASVRRWDDVTVTYANKNVGIVASLGVEDIDINYNYEAKLIGIMANGKVDGNAADVDSTISVNFDLSRWYLSLNHFTVNNIGSITAKLKGNNVIDWIANPILSIVLEVIEDDLLNVMDTAVSKVVTNAFDNLNEIIAGVVQQS